MPAATKSRSRVDSDQIAAVRRFNRFYTRQVGALRRGLLGSAFTLTEARVLYELAHEPNESASALGSRLELDPGQLSRIVQRLEQRGLLGRHAVAGDGRRATLELTANGRRAFADLDRRSQSEVSDALARIPVEGRRRVVAAMQTVERLLGSGSPSESTAPPYLLRPPRAGDFGWVVQRHGALYAEEFGWDERFEGLVASVVGEFIGSFDSRRERCWIAEREGENVGSIFLVKESETVCKLRLLLVEPSARGLGIGKRLVEECIAFGGQAGYRKMTLWTNSVLTSARAIYIAAGFKKVKSEAHQRFGPRLVGETWELQLARPRR